MSPFDDADRQILASTEAAPARISGSEMRAMLDFDDGSAISGYRVPALYVHAVVPADIGVLRTLCPHVVVGATVGSGHWPQLEVPSK
jgi:hypothetical protein